MNCLRFPHELYCGADSLDKVFGKDYSDVLIISDSEPLTSYCFTQKILSGFNSLMTGTKLICSDEPDELFKHAYSFANTEMPESIVAVGSGFVQDCAAAVSRITETPFVSVVSTAPTSLHEYNTLDVFLYKSSPDVCIIDPSFITAADSLKLAYDALGMMTLALEASVCAGDRFISFTAQKAFCEIYNNIMPSFRGEISARENLVNAMYGAYSAYINSFAYSWESDAYRTASFFSGFSVSRLSALAVCITYLSEHYNEVYPEKFRALAALAEPNEDIGSVSLLLLNNIRRIQATLSFPSSIKNCSVSESDFLVISRSLSVEEKDFYCRCYYGNVNFVKRNKFSSLID